MAACFGLLQAAHGPVLRRATMGCVHEGVAGPLAPPPREHHVGRAAVSRLGAPRQPAYSSMWNPVALTTAAQRCVSLPSIAENSLVFRATGSNENSAIF